MEHKMISIADRVFEILEHEILTGVFDRDGLLTENALSERLSVSRTPVREALRRLEQEHLIEMTSRGIRVIGITKEDIADLYAIRLMIEPDAASRAAKRAGADDLKEMEGILDLQEFYTGKGDPDNIRDADSRFHIALYRLSGSAVLYDTLEPLHRKASRYRSVSVSSPGRAARSLEEHRAIYRAIRDHEPEEAAKLTRAHVLAAAESLKAVPKA